MKKALFTLLFLGFLTLSAQTYTAGNRYFGRNNYIESDKSPLASFFVFFSTNYLSIIHTLDKEVGGTLISRY